MRFKAVAAACALLVCIVTPGIAQNPDGPVGSLMLEPSFTFGSMMDFDQQTSRWASWMPKPDDDDDDDDPPGDPGAKGWTPFVKSPNDASANYWRGGLSVLMPAGRSWSVGAHFNLSRLEVENVTPGYFRTQTDVNNWELGARFRYWWNLPE